MRGGGDPMKLRSVMAAIERILLVLLGAAMAVIVALNFANVVGRYVFAAPIRPADEIMTYLMVWGVFLGAAVVTLRGAHLNMDLAVSLLPRAAQKALRVLAGAVLVVVMIHIAVQSLEYIDVLSTIGMRSMAAEIPMAWPHAALPVGFVLMAAFAVVRLIQEFLPGSAAAPDADR
jgi:TRAP-type C4-dicarboxylate transport system permease small subunit